MNALILGKSFSVTTQMSHTTQDAIPSAKIWILLVISGVLVLAKIQGVGSNLFNYSLNVEKR